VPQPENRAVEKGQERTYNVVVVVVVLGVFLFVDEIKEAKGTEFQYWHVS
jgi:hypothetical protein